MKDTTEWIDWNDKNNTGEKKWYVWNDKKNSREEKQMEAHSCQPS